MDISIYLEPLKFDSETFKANTLGSIASFHTDQDYPNIEEAKVAILGIADGRLSGDNTGCHLAAQHIRQYLYSLYWPYQVLPIIDLGNIRAGNSVDDTYFAMSEVIFELIKNNTTVVLLGGGHNLTYGNYMAYEKLERLINLAVVDSKINMVKQGDDHDADSFMNKIILSQPNYLFDYSNIGHQSYLVDPSVIKLMEELHFEAYRLGDVNNDITEMEPIIRNADIMSVDISAVRFSDAPGNANASPNGLYGEQLCQLARYAGLNEMLSSIGFYEINHELDMQGQSHHLVAQAIWCFLEGIMHRKDDTPIYNKSDFLKYNVTLSEDQEYTLVFYKSKKSERWWMDIPFPPNKGMKYERHKFIPCSFKDYQMACNEEMPNKWWKAYQKLN